MRIAWSTVVLLCAMACATTAPGTLPPARYDRLERAGSLPGVHPNVAIAIQHALFFHPDCPRWEIQVQRVSDDLRFAELRVCGTVRRYQDIAPSISGRGAVTDAPTWIEVTRATAG